MTVSELKKLLEKYPDDYHVIHNVYPTPWDSALDDFIFMSNSEYEQAIENEEIE